MGRKPKEIQWSEHQRLLTKQINKTSKALSNLNEFSALIKDGSKYKERFIKETNQYRRKTKMIEVVIGDLHYSGKRNDNDVRALLRKQIDQLSDSYEKGMWVRLSFMGDDIEGELHLSSLDKHQQENTVSQVTGVWRHYVDFVRSVAKIVPEDRIEIVFVPESNHGQLRFHGMTRGQQPSNDVGYIIRDCMMANLPESIKFWPSEDGIVVTDDTYYFHGDKPWAKKPDKAIAFLARKFGQYKNVQTAHLHYAMMQQIGNNWFMICPKATSNTEAYVKEAGYPNTNPAAMHIYRGVNNKIDGWRIVEV